MTEKEKQVCRNIAAIMRVKRLGASRIAPQARLSSGALQAIIDGKRRISGEEAALLAKAMDVPYEAIYAETVEAAIENQFTPRSGRFAWANGGKADCHGLHGKPRNDRGERATALVIGTGKGRKKGW